MQGLSGQRTLVTGALGALGHSVSVSLRSVGAKVTGFDLRSPIEDDRTLFDDFRVGDIRDVRLLEEAVSGVDAVVHLAAWVHHVPANQEEKKTLFEMNQFATERLCKLLSRKRLVFMSTVAVYGDRAQGRLDELSPLIPDSPYAESKAEAEKAVLAVGGVVLRLPIVYGARDRGNMLRMIRAIRKGWFVLPGRGGVRRSFISRWNVADAVVRALTIERASGSVFLVTDDQDMTMAEVVDRIAYMLVVRRPLRLPRGLLQLGAISGSAIQRAFGWRVPLNLNSYRKLVRELTFDCLRAKKVLGYCPVWSFERGIDEEIRWFLAEESA